MQEKGDALTDRLDQVGTNAWPDMLAELVDVFSSHFQREGSDDPRDAALKVVMALSKHFGGRAMYIPRGLRLKLALRNVSICEEFNGRNANELVRRYDLSMRQLRTILKRGLPAKRRG